MKESCTRVRASAYIHHFAGAAVQPLFGQKEPLKMLFRELKLNPEKPAAGLQRTVSMIS
jgi:hypothetical protein